MELSNVKHYLLTKSDAFFNFLTGLELLPICSFKNRMFIISLSDLDACAKLGFLGHVGQIKLVYSTVLAKKSKWVIFNLIYWKTL